MYWLLDGQLRVKLKALGIDLPEGRLTADVAGDVLAKLREIYVEAPERVDPPPAEP